jgi:deazaflavin-dependent oxidoreductase (nitroreductase family)
LAQRAKDQLVILHKPFNENQHFGKCEMNNTYDLSTQSYRLSFKRFNVFMLWMWRLGFRRWINIWPSVFGRIMVLTHTGRITGLVRRTPVNYFRLEDSIYCTAGFGHQTDWYRNILAYPEVEVWLPDGWRNGVAEYISADEGRDQLLRQVLIASGFAAPLFGVDPHKLDEAEFSAATQDYRLVRIQLGEPLSGPGGPGDLAWIWIPISALLALAALLVRSRGAK